MSAEAIESPLPDSWQVILWRQAELERGGYPVVTAMRIAEHIEIDLHHACALLANGATVAQAVRILF